MAPNVAPYESHSVPFAPSSLARMDTDRMSAYRRNLDFYRGLQWEAYSRHRQLVFNYARVAVDKVTSYLVEGLSTACYPLDPSQHDDAIKERIDCAEALLAQVRDDNGLDALDYETELDCAVLGDACYKVTWDPDACRIRVTAPPTSGIYAMWMPDDRSRVECVFSRYRLLRDEVKVLFGVDIPQQHA